MSAAEPARSAGEPVASRGDAARVSPLRDVDLDPAGRSYALDEPPRWWGRPLAETRWSLELTRLLVDPVFAGFGVPHGDGRPVVLMPGLGAGDQSLAVLAAWLYRIGYAPRVCGFVANVDCSDRAFARVMRRVEQLHGRHGRRVALIGHSRGAHYARAAGASRPEQVSHAISLGADLQGMFGISLPTTYAVRAVRLGVELTGRAREPRCMSAGCQCEFARAFRASFPGDRVQMTSVYSRQDGVVQWQRSIISEADCVEVTGSHTGLVFNRKVYRVIADALAAPEL
jgi:pimeloyl-ACP methyl ester carboxylesterase